MLYWRVLYYQDVQCLGKIANETRLPTDGSVKDNFFVVGILPASPDFEACARSHPEMGYKYIRTHNE